APAAGDRPAVDAGRVGRQPAALRRGRRARAVRGRPRRRDRRVGLGGGRRDGRRRARRRDPHHGALDGLTDDARQARASSTARATALPGLVRTGRGRSARRPAAGAMLAWASTTTSAPRRETASRTASATLRWYAS